MNYTLIAAFGSAAANNWTLWCFTILIAGLIFFSVGLLIGRRHWTRFKDLSEAMNKNHAKRSRVIKEKLDRLESFNASIKSLN